MRQTRLRRFPSSGGKLPNLTEITPQEFERRTKIVEDLGKKVGFEGTVTYAHSYNKSGGAQFIGHSKGDKIQIDAQAFYRAEKGDFELISFLAHERGHQRINKEKNLSKFRRSDPDDPLENAAADMIGAIAAKPHSEKAFLELRARAVAHALEATGGEVRRAAALLKDVLRRAGIPPGIVD